MIELKDVSHRLSTPAGPVTALDCVDLTVAAGEAVALMGSNGSGKSTLCRCLNGLLIPESGTVSIDGLRPRDRDSAIEIRRRVGMVFQDPSQQLVTWSVEEEIAFGLENLQVAPSVIESVVSGALGIWDLGKLRRRHPLGLSGGEMARVSLAAVLAMKPRYLVVDEPTSLLDAQGRVTLLEAVANIRARGDIGLIWVTQYPEEAALFDRLVVMNEGRIVADDSPAQLLSEVPGIASWGLEPTPAALLASSLRRKGVAISKGVFLIEPLLAELDSIGVRPPLGGNPGGLGWEARPVSDARNGTSPAPVAPKPQEAHTGEHGPWWEAGSAARVPSRCVGHVTREAVSQSAGPAAAYERPKPRGRSRVPALSMAGVCCGYPGGRQVLTDVWVKLGAGEGLGLIGPSGSGKSTLILAAAGALEPSSGSISRNAPGGEGERVSLVPQLPEEGFCAASVMEEVAFALRGAGLAPAHVRRCAEGWLEAVGLDPAGVGSRSPLSLSDGEKKKVALASALAPESGLLLLDEPTQGLDGPSSGKVLRAIRNHLYAGGAALIASHAGDFLLCATDSAIALGGGGVMERGGWSELLLGEKPSVLVLSGQILEAVRWGRFRPSPPFLFSAAAAIECFSDEVVRALESVSTGGVHQNSSRRLGPRSGGAPGKTP